MDGNEKKKVLSDIPHEKLPLKSLAAHFYNQLVLPKSGEPNWA